MEEFFLAPLYIYIYMVQYNTYIIIVPWLVYQSSLNFNAIDSSVKHIFLAQIQHFK
jgi:hypothetical protein